MHNQKNAFMSLSSEVLLENLNQFFMTRATFPSLVQIAILQQSTLKGTPRHTPMARTVRQGNINEHINSHLISFDL